MTTLTSILLQEDLMIKLISFWNVVDLNRVASTSRSIHAALQQCWTVDTGLARWFDNPFDFRQMLGNCGAVVSGSTAVQFFDRTRYPASDLDIVIPITTTYSMGLWLMENGYTFQPRGTDFTDFVASLVTVMKRSRSHRLAKPMIRVFDFYGHPLSASDTGRHVQLITTRDDPFAHILQYHSTAVMNVITWECAISLFPRQTFIDRKTYVARAAYIGAATAWRQKYMARGFEIICNFDGKINIGCRSFSDNKCWVIPFNIQDIDRDRIHTRHPQNSLLFFVHPSDDKMDCALKIGDSNILRSFPLSNEVYWEEYEEDS